MSDDYLTIELISGTFRRDYPELREETFAVVHHKGTAAEVVGTDEDRPACIAPVQWARDIAVHRGVEFVAPDASIAFHLHDGVWHAYNVDEMAAAGKRVSNPFGDAQPAILFRNAAPAEAA